MSDTGDLYRRAAARCIYIDIHRDADQLPPCSACLLAVASAVASSAPRTRSAHLPPLGAGHGISDDTKGGTA